MNKKLGGNQIIQFFPEKNIVEKGKWICHLSMDSTAMDGLCYRLIDLSVLQEILSFVSKCFSWHGEKPAEIR